MVSPKPRERLPVCWVEPLAFAKAIDTFRVGHRRKWTCLERKPLTETKLLLEAMPAERAMNTALAFFSISVFKALAVKHQFEKLS